MRERAKRRSQELLESSDHLQSEVSHEEAEGLLSNAQSVSTSFRGFSDDDLAVLAEHLSVMRFDAGQTVVQKGEVGSWFGLLLSGTLEITLPGGSISVNAGEVIGEMAIWQPGAVRSATLTGGTAGLIATMLVSELEQFVNDCPEVRFGVACVACECLSDL